MREQKCPGGYHHAMTPIGEAAEKKRPDGYLESVDSKIYAGDERWPKVCTACGYQFSDTDTEDVRQVFTRSVYRRADNGFETTLEDAPAGAIWNAWWQMDCGSLAGPDGKSFTVKLPGGHDWCIDSRASNCDSLCANCGRPYFQHDQGTFEERQKACPEGYTDARPHKCWVRHGEAPNLTVDKAGITCGAGAGSIVVPGWHGFLRGGQLVQC